MREARVVVQVRLPGMATHYRHGEKNITACGIVGAQHQAFDPRHVDCSRCRKTKIYRGTNK